MALRIRKEKEAIVQYKSGIDAWQTGFIGFFTRNQGLISTVVVAVIFAGSTPWWVPKHITNSPLTLQLWWILLFFFLFFLLLLIFGFLYLRKRSKRSLAIKKNLHDFAHFLRDKQVELFAKPQITEDQRVTGEEKAIFLSMAKNICDYAKEYFLLLTRDDTVGVSIRLAQEIKNSNDKGGSQIYYSTIARSSGTNPLREKFSQPISKNEGIPAYFLKNDCEGILIYYDIPKAAVEGAYAITETDRKFPKEIASFMVAPLNGWDGKKSSLIGLLFVTSKKDDTFGLKHTDSLLYIGDMVARAIAGAVVQLSRIGYTDIKLWEQLDE